MGYKEIDIKVPIYVADNELKQLIGRKSKLKTFTFHIIKKSLDARQKNNIFWLFRIGIVSDEIRDGKRPSIPMLEPENVKRSKHVIVVGSGPAGIFSAIYLLLSGFRVTLIERGSNVEERKGAIEIFEKTNIFNSSNNYAFGEGGAGTFSDGKLTSRTKNISPERNFIFKYFIESGAPSEIFYMTHPHLGSDNLFRITKNIRKKLESYGCTILFNTVLTDLLIKDGKAISAYTSGGSIEADYFIIATGHSAFETYRMLFNKGIPFHAKNFALGFRAEHLQEIINLAQWGVPNIPGVKAAEYRLTSQSSENTGVYSFCMCPGGIVVPATAYSHTNIVNGMSYYKRDNRWANAAIVASVNIEKLFNREVSASETLDWLENIESTFYNYTGNYDAPACLIKNFLSDKNDGLLPSSSYPFNLKETDFKELLPPKIIQPLKNGLSDFCMKLKGYESGIILGLESKTSSPIQVQRDPQKMYSKFTNLYIAGEGSGWAGGIISSASDGLKIAQQIINK
jgi:hypothetical protein